MNPWRAALTSATASGKSTRIASRSAIVCSSALPDGWSWETVRDERRKNLRFALDASAWPGRDDVLIEGLGPEALDQFGLS